MAPVLSTAVIEQYDEHKRQGMIQGYKIPLFAGPVLTLLFLWARFIVQKHLKKISQMRKLEKAKQS